MMSPEARVVADLQNAGADLYMTDLSPEVARELLAAPMGALACDGQLMLRDAAQCTDSHRACALAAEGLRLLALAAGLDPQLMLLASLMSYKAEMSEPGRIKHVTVMLDRRA